MLKRSIFILLSILSIVNISNATYSIKNDENSITTYFVLRDTSGDPCTALTITNLKMHYQEYQLAQVVDQAVTALAAANSAWDDFKAFHCGNGVYRVDWPDAAFDAGIGKPVTLIVTVPTYDVITTYLELVLQPPVNVHTVLEATPFDASADTVDVGKLAGNAQRVTDLAEIAQYLFAESCTLATIIADDSVIAKTLATGGDISEYDEDTDSQQAIRDAVIAAADVLYNPDASSSITTGSQGATTYANCATNNATYWEIGDENGVNTIEAICEFNMGSGRVTTGVVIDGYYSRNPPGDYVVETYAYNYTSAEYDKLSAGTADTEMRPGSSDKLYAFTLSSSYTDSVTVPGEVKIKFVSTRPTTQDGDILYLDYVAVAGTQEGGTTPQSVAQAVWDYATVDVRCGNGEYKAGHMIKRLVALGIAVDGVTSTTVFTLDDGIAVDDAYNNMLLEIRDESSATRDIEVRRIVDWAGATKTVTLDRALSFTPAADDHIHISGVYYGLTRATDHRDRPLWYMRSR